MNDALQNFDPEMSRPVATEPDLSRQASTDDEYLSIKEAQTIFTSHGRAVTERTLQRYCDRRHLDGQKHLTGEGEKWFVTRSSVLRRIREIEEFDKLKLSRQVATSRDASAPVVPASTPDALAKNPRQAPTDEVVSLPVAEDTSHSTPSDLSRQAATGRDQSRHDELRNKRENSVNEYERELYERMIGVLDEQRADLMKDKALLQADKEALLRQLEMKDKQIDRFFASDRDTKTLMGSLQSLVSALWPKSAKVEGERYAPVRDALESGLDEVRHGNVR